MLGDSSDWSFKQWWEENKAQRNLDRRERYKRNPVYRKRVLDQNRTSREKRANTPEAIAAREEKEARRRAIKVIADAGFECLVNPELADGRTYRGRVYTIGAVALVLRRSVQTVRIWEKKGKIPTTDLRRARRGDRLYPEKLIAEIRDVAIASGLIKEDEKQVFAKAKKFVVKVRLSSGEESLKRLYRVGVLSEAMGRTTSAVLRMEKNGYLPKTTLRTGGNHRLYSYGMIVAARDIVDDLGGVAEKKSWPVFAGKVKEAWKESGLLGAVVV